MSEWTRIVRTGPLKTPRATHHEFLRDRDGPRPEGEARAPSSSASCSPGTRGSRVVFHHGAACGAGTLPKSDDVRRMDRHRRQPEAEGRRTTVRACRIRGMNRPQHSSRLTGAQTAGSTETRTTSDQGQVLASPGSGANRDPPRARAGGRGDDPTACDSPRSASDWVPPTFAQRRSPLDRAAVLGSTRSTAKYRFDAFATSTPHYPIRARVDPNRLVRQQ